MEEYVYIEVKLVLKPGQNEESIQDIVSECDYKFVHDEIVETVITDIRDYETSEEEEEEYDLDTCGCSDPGCPCTGPKRGGPP
tara:strand:+ start:164 stop:412 length:249 start_codon:yes stop_codon:yes gene_type:complete